MADLDHPRDGVPSANTTGGTLHDYTRFACHGCVLIMIAPHATGHERARDGTLMRVDCEHSTSWVATHYDLNLRVIRQARGSDEDVHRLAAWWAQG